MRERDVSQLRVAPGTPDLCTEYARSRALGRIFAFYRKSRGKCDAARECIGIIRGNVPKQIEKAFAQLTPAWSDYAVATVYALLMPHRRRKALGVYFTPPPLVDHLLERVSQQGEVLHYHKIRDPAAGGAAFLVPLARRAAAAWCAEGVSKRQILGRLQSRLSGQELDRGLASVANALIRRMLQREFGFSADQVRALRLVRVGDRLKQPLSFRHHHEIGNPPYLRLGAEAHVVWREQFADIANGRLNLYAMFVRRALEEVPPNGIVAHILPASFVGGPEFAKFRVRVLQLADVLAIDMLDQRVRVFLDAIQDACFLVLRRRVAPVAVPPHSVASSGRVGAGGEFTALGLARLQPNGLPWVLPGERSRGATVTLADCGYKATIGNVVANRESERLFKRPARDRVPLAWAKSIRVDGVFDFDRGRRAENARGRGFVEVPLDAPYVCRKPCVLVQRTSSSSQTRRVVAAAVPRAFLREHGGIAGENHVIVLVPTRRDALEPALLARMLNSTEASVELGRVCGSAAISVRVLEKVRLPAMAPAAKKANEPQTVMQKRAAWRRRSVGSLQIAQRSAGLRAE